MDWKDKVGWQLRGNVKSSQVTVGGTSVQLFPRSTNRIALIISPPIAGRISLSWGQAPAVDQTGLVLVAGGFPIQLWVEDFGALCALECQAIADAAGRLVAITEVFAPPP